MSDNNSELNPCPYCIGMATLEKSMFGISVICVDCKYQNSVYKTLKEAVNNWNSHSIKRSGLKIIKLQQELTEAQAEILRLQEKKK